MVLPLAMVAYCQFESVVYFGRKQDLPLRGLNYNKNLNKVTGINTITFSTYLYGAMLPIQIWISSARLILCPVTDLLGFDII